MQHHILGEEKDWFTGGAVLHRSYLLCLLKAQHLHQQCGTLAIPHYVKRPQKDYEFVLKGKAIPDEVPAVPGPLMIEYGGDADGQELQPLEDNEYGDAERWEEWDELGDALAAMIEAEQAGQQELQDQEEEEEEDKPAADEDVANDDVEREASLDDPDVGEPVVGQRGVLKTWDWGVHGHC